MKNRPAIPKHIKRKVRQRCGFGCVICGIPIYEYDHMPGYAKVKRHLENELTLLCPTHHSAKTKGLLAESQVEEANKKPFNLKNSATSPFALIFGGAAPEIQLAQQTFICSDLRRPTWMLPVLSRGHAPLGFVIDTNGVMLNLEAHNLQGEPIIRIKNSELEISTTAFDITFIGQKLTIRDDNGLIALSLIFEPPNRICIEKCHITTNGVTVDINDKEIKFGGDITPSFQLAGNGTIDANVGVLIGAAPRGLSIGITTGI